MAKNCPGSLGREHLAEGNPRMDLQGVLGGGH